MTSGPLLAAFVAYFVVVVVVGVFAGRRVPGHGEEYFLAGRRVPGWLVAFAAAAAGESGWVMLGLVGAGYTGGVSALWLIPGCVAGYAFNIFVLGPALQKFAQTHQAVTIPEVLAVGTGARRGPVRSLAAVIVLLMLGAYVAAQFNAAGKAFEAFLGLPYATGVMIGAGLVVAYTIAGGQRAVAWTHLLQASMMVGALVVVPLAGLAAAGGPGALAGMLRAADPSLLSLWGGAHGWGALGLVLGWSGVGLGYPGQPHVLTQYMTGRSARDVRSGWWISIGWAICVFGGATLAGLVVRGWIGFVADPESGLPLLAVRLLPAWGQGLVLAAILAAICSTADSQMLAVTAALGVDLLHMEQAGVLTSWRQRTSARSLFALVGLGALALALSRNRVIFSFVLYAWGVLGAGLGPSLIVVVRGRVLSPARCVAVMLIGSMVAVVWRAVPVLHARVYELVPAFLLGLAAAWALSRRAPPDESTPRSG